MPDDLQFETTDEIEPLVGTIGQPRAISALALDIDAAGFNLFISGVPGTGRSTALRSHVEQIAATKPVPPDWGYVHNFQNPSQPVSLSLPCGMMRELARDMEDLTDACRREIPSVFDSDDYTHRIEQVMKDVQETRQALTDELEQEAQKESFTLTFNQTGITPVPLIEGRPMTQEEFNSVPDALREELRGKAALDRTKEVDVELVKLTLTPIIDGSRLNTPVTRTWSRIWARWNPTWSSISTCLRPERTRRRPRTACPSHRGTTTSSASTESTTWSTTPPARGHRSSSSTAPPTTTSSAG